MHHFQLLLFVFSLVMPFGAFETDNASNGWDNAQLIESCRADAQFAEETDAEQPELYLTNLSVIDCSAHIVGSLVAVPGTGSTPDNAGAPGCRPPPAVRID